MGLFATADSSLLFEGLLFFASVCCASGEGKSLFGKSRAGAILLRGRRDGFKLVLLGGGRTVFSIGGTNRLEALLPGNLIQELSASLYTRFSTDANTSLPFGGDTLGFYIELVRPMVGLHDWRRPKADMEGVVVRSP